MQLFIGCVGTAAIATIYLISALYQDYCKGLKRHERILRERVAYMLWVMTDQVD